MNDETYIKHYEWMNVIKGGAQRDVYAVLYAFGGSKGGACLTIKFIAQKAGYNERQAQRALVELRSEGLLEVEYIAGQKSIFHTLTPTKNDTPTKNGGSTPTKNDTPIIKDIINNRENIEAAPKKSKFQKPTIEQIAAYCQERQNGIDAEAFFYFYESKGWLVGKSPMKDWQAAVRTWEQKRKNETNHGNNNPRQAATTAANTTEAKPYSRIQQLGDTRFNLK